MQVTRKEATEKVLKIIEQASFAQFTVQRMLVFSYNRGIKFRWVFIMISNQQLLTSESIHGDLRYCRAER